MRPEFKSYCREGVHPSIVINNATELTKGQFIQVLHNLRERVGQTELVQEDSNVPGDKFTEASWGLCSREAQVYPDPEMHTFPQDFADRGRVSSLNPPAGHACPMRVAQIRQGRTGCFYDCRVFQKRYKTPDRLLAVRLIDEAINKAGE